MNRRLLVFFGILLFFNLLTLMKYPLASIDESWLSSNAYSNFYKDYKSINYPFVQQNWGVPYTMNFLFGLVYRVFGLGLVQGRLFELFIGFSVLVILYKIGKEFFSERIAFWAILYFASSRMFFYSSHLIRTDMALTFLVLLSFWNFLKFIKTKKLIYIFLAGFIVSYSCEVHQNGVFFWLATIFAWILINPIRKIFSRGLIYFLLGTSLYLIYYIPAHILSDLPTFISQRSYSLFVDHPMPILSSYTPGKLLSLEIDRYLNYFTSLRAVELVIMIMSLFWAVKQKDTIIKYTSLFISIPMVLFFPFSSNKTELYLISFFPFFALLISSFFNKIDIDNFRLQLVFFFKNKRGVNLLPAVKVFYLLALLVILNFGAQLKIAYDHRDYNYLKINFLVNNKSRDLVIFGNPSFWLPLRNLNYKSHYVLTYYRIFENKSIEEAMESIKPDLIIIDPLFENRLVEEDGYINEENLRRKLYMLSRREFTDYLDKNTSLALDYNDYYYGRIKIYKVK